MSAFNESVRKVKAVPACPFVVYHLELAWQIEVLEFTQCAKVPLEILCWNLYQLPTPNSLALSRK